MFIIIIFNVFESCSLVLLIFIPVGTCLHTGKVFGSYPEVSEWLLYAHEVSVTD